MNILKKVNKKVLSAPVQFLLVLSLTLIFVLSGCTPATPGTHPLHIINSSGKTITVNVEIPDIETDAFWNGLENRSALPKNDGMLFDWEKEVTVPFQMRNTSIPLDIAFISSSLEILEIQQMEPFYPDEYAPSHSYRYALEVNQDFFTRNNIQAGDRIEFTP